LRARSPSGEKVLERRGLSSSLRNSSLSHLDQPWLKPNLPLDEREELFEAWLGDLPDAPILEPKSPADFIQPVLLQRQDYLEEAPTLAFIVGPLLPLPPAPLRPASIYGHLPFGTRTASDTVIYRWEAFPTSRKITRTPGGGTIGRDTYGAPTSEIPFAPTGFGAVARFALPNLLPACFRWLTAAGQRTHRVWGVGSTLWTIRRWR
jgi:hypothetical protein